ncbi:hypothetical protein [Burkholderia contaminans]|uniref:hypothetical protein n=1 Tax=Burkholderia contaminans TaxID=488447 RepID=UPI000F5AC417|nr:hypothetical protein [Burkholderia contaminans]
MEFKLTVKDMTASFRESLDGPPRPTIGRMADDACGRREAGDGFANRNGAATGQLGHAAFRHFASRAGVSCRAARALRRGIQSKGLRCCHWQATNGKRRSAPVDERASPDHSSRRTALMITITVQGNAPISRIDPARDAGSADSPGSQQIAQIIQELMAELKSLLSGQNGNDSPSSPPAGSTGRSAPPLANHEVQPQTLPSNGPNAPVDPNTPRTRNDQNPPVGGAPSGSPAKLSTNAGGVAQAGAIDGIAPTSTQTVHTGTGNDKTFNVTNDTNRPESFTYAVQGQNKATLTLAPGQTGTFVGGSHDIGVRISPSDANGNTHPDEVLYEDGGADNGQASGAGNPDVSKVDGDKDFAGHDENMTVTLSDGRTAGDGDAIRPYLYSTDDAAAMGLAGDPSKTVNIVMSDRNQA